MTSKSKSLTKLMVAVLVIAFLAYVALIGLPVGNTFVGGALNMDKSGIKLGFDLSGGSVITYEADTKSVSDAEMTTAVNMLQTRLTNLGYTEATVTKQGDKRIRIEIPNVSNDEAIEKLGTPGKLTFRTSEGEVLMEGSSEFIKNASAQFDASMGNFVQLEFTAKGQEAFAAATAATVGSQLYIYLDETVQSAPQVKTVINGSTAVIEGDFTAEDAAWLANIIKEGQMPFSLILKSTSSVSASLGEKALSTSMTACGIGILLVLIFMLIFYRLPGFVADIALVGYVSILLLILCEFETITGSVINLTLPGIAGIVLGIGMAVDANIIMFERIKDEYRNGKSFRSAYEDGFKRSLSAIIDSNITTLIGGITLWALATGSVQGFAVTLVFSVVISLFSALLLTRMFVNLLMPIANEEPALFKLKRLEVEE